MSQTKFIHQTTTKVVDVLGGCIRIVVNELLPSLIPATWELTHVSFAMDTSQMSQAVLDGNRKVIEVDSPLREEVFELAGEDVMVGHTTNRTSQMPGNLARSRLWGVKFLSELHDLRHAQFGPPRRV